MNKYEIIFSYSDGEGQGQAQKARRGSVGPLESSIKSTF